MKKQEKTNLSDRISRQSVLHLLIELAYVEDDCYSPDGVRYLLDAEQVKTAVERLPGQDEEMAERYGCREIIRSTIRQMKKDGEL